MCPALAGLIRMPGVEHHDHGCQGVRDAKQDAIFQPRELPPLQAACEEGHAAVSRAVLQEIHGDEHQHGALAKPRPQGDGPGCLRMIADAEPPHGQPEEGQHAFQDQHLPPAIGSQQPASKGSGRRHRQRLAERPIRIGPGAFASREPVGQQHHRRRKHTALRNPQQKAHHLELPERARKAALDRANAPGNQEQADDLPGAPRRRPIAARDLEHHVTKKEDAGGLSLHPIVHPQVLHHGRDCRVQRQRDVRPVHI